jgi:hypothetical protein
MPLRYNGTTIGKIHISQEFGGKKHNFELQIRQGNCLAVIIHCRKATEEEQAKNPEAKYWHTLWTFYADEQHMKNIIKNEGDIFFGEKVTSISLNMFYPECKTLLKYYTLSGHKVTCYYKAPKDAKKK